MELTGVVEQIYPKDEKGDGSLKIGGKYYKYSVLNRRKDPWEPPQAVGQTVSLVYNESEYNGKTYNWVESIQVIESAPFTEADMAQPDSSKVPFRSPQQIMRSDALRIASDGMAVRAPQDYDATAFGAAVVALASYYMAYIESGLE
jgi:hypothetical protein